MTPLLKNQMTTVALRPNYGVRIFVIRRDGSAALPVGEQGEPGDYIVKTTLTPEHVNGVTKVAGIILFPEDYDRIRFARQVAIGRV